MLILFKIMSVVSPNKIYLTFVQYENLNVAYMYSKNCPTNV